jgi:hypothetical protein
MYYWVSSTLLICRPSDFTVSENAGIESRTVAMLALAVSSGMDLDPEIFALEDPEYHSESGFGSGSKVTWNEE